MGPEAAIILGTGEGEPIGGTFVLAPPHAVHWFRNVTESSARMLNLHTPGGFAEYMRERASLTAQGLEPDAAFFERHDIFDV